MDLCCQVKHMQQDSHWKHSDPPPFFSYIEFQVIFSGPYDQAHDATKQKVKLSVF